MAFTHPKDARKGHEWETATDGHDVFLYASVQENGVERLLGSVLVPNGTYRQAKWTADGTGAAVGVPNIVDRVRSRTVYLNFDRRGGSIVPLMFRNAEDAVAAITDATIAAQVAVTVEEGQGID